MNFVKHFSPGGRFFAPATQFFLSLVILLSICNWHSIYEEDELAKAAQIMALDHNAGWTHFARVFDYYEKDLFSSYYLAATAFYKFTGLEAVRALNFFSILCGATFLAVMPICVRRLFGISPWLTWFALLNTPLLVITFSYGNEASFAIAMATLAAFSLTTRTLIGFIVAGIFYTLAAYGRSDYLFLFPALALITIVRNGATIDWRQTLRNLTFFSVTALICGVAYLTLVLQKFPHPGLFEHQTNLKVFAAFLLYSPNPVLFFLALLGVVICVITPRKKYFWLLLVLLQAVPYLTRLTSPKYILPSLVVIVIFALVGIQTIFRRSPIAIIAILVIPWVISVTPFGIFGPKRSVYWYMPSDDGPIPTGGYLAFYTKVKQGFYQKRYDVEHDLITRALPLLKREPNGADLVGYLEHQSFRLWAVRHERWDMSFDVMPFPLYDPDYISDETHRTKFAIKTSYLYTLKQTPDERTKLDGLFRDGSVRSIISNSTPDPFPDLIQIGLNVAPGTDVDLGKRILFLNQHYNGNQSLRRNEFLKDFGAVSWISRARFDAEKAQLSSPVYQDAQWVCFSTPVTNAVYYSMRFPPAYSKLR